MPKELPDYRDVLERLDAAFPGRELLTKSELAAWCGVKVETLNKRYGWPRGLLTKVRVAKDMAS